MIKIDEDYYKPIEYNDANILNVVALKKYGKKNDGIDGYALLFGKKSCINTYCNQYQNQHQNQ